MLGLRSSAAVLALCAITTAVGTTHVQEPITSSTSVVLAGDSIAHGGWQGGGVLLADRIGDRIWGANHSNMRTVAEGGMCLIATGCVGAPLVDRWAGVLALTPTPTTVIVIAGTNDLGRGLSDDVLKNAYTQLVDQAAAVGTRVLIATIPPRTDTQWTTYWTWGPQRERLNSWLRLTWPSDVVDVDNALRRADTWADPMWMYDPIHPSWIGAVRISDSVPLGRIQ